MLPADRREWSVTSMVATYDGVLDFTQRITSMLMAGIFLRGCEQANPPLHLRRKPSGSRQCNSLLDPSVVGHRKSVCPLAPCAVRRACAIASVREQDRADGRSVRAITVSVWIGINDR